MIAWSLFVNPMLLNGGRWTLSLLLPLCVSAAIVYKTLRTNNLRRLPLEILSLIGYMVLGLIALGLGLWIVAAIMTG